MTTFSITISLSTDAQTDEHLADEARIKDELRSWLEGLGARIEELTVYQYRAGRKGRSRR